MKLAELGVKISADVAAFQNDMRRVSDVVQKTASSIEGRFGAAAAAVRGVGLAIGTAFAATGAIASFVNRVNAGLLAIKDLSEATGASIENISALENVMRRAGGSLEQAAPVLIAFNRALSETKENDAVVSIIRQLGLDLDKLRSMDPVEALRAVAIAMSRFEDDGNKARAFFVLFQRSIREAGPLLREFVEQQEFAATVTAAQVAEADRLNKEIGQLKANFEDAARKINGVLVPALNELFKLYRERGILGVLFGGRQDEKRREVENYTSQIALLGKRLDRVLELERAGVPGMSARVRQLRGELEELMRKGAQAGDELMAMVGPYKRDDDKTKEDKPRPRLRLPGDADKGRQKEQIDEARTALAQYIETLGRELSQLQDLSEEQKALNLLRSLGTLGEIPQVRELVVNQARLVDAVREEAREREVLMRIRQQRDTDIAQQERELAEALEEVRRITGQVTEEQRKRLALYNELLEKGRITEEEFRAAVVATVNRVKDASDQARDVAKDLGMTFASAFEDAVVAGRKLSEVLRGLVADVARLITRELVTRPMAEFITGSLRGFFGGPRAEGGPVLPRRAYLVGERGPELFLPRVAGTIVPNMRAMAREAIVVNIHMAAGANADDFRASARQMAVEMSRRLARVRGAA